MARSSCIDQVEDVRCRDAACGICINLLKVFQRTIAKIGFEEDQTTHTDPISLYHNSTKKTFFEKIASKSKPLLLISIAYKADKIFVRSILFWQFSESCFNLNWLPL